MTAKRFEIIENSKNYLRVDDKTKKMFYLNEEQVVDLLNGLNDENEQLKKEIRNLKLENQLLLEEMKEIRDKLTIYLKIKGCDVE